MFNDMGPEVSTTQSIDASAGSPPTLARPIGTKPAVPAAIPQGLVDVSLIDGPTAAAAASISISQWYELVRRGVAPQPAFRAPRCTRWQLAAVRAFLVTWASRGSEGEAARELVTNARRASKAAQSKREAARVRG